MKKAKVSPQALNVAPPKVTIRLKLGPRPPELDPFPCCLCVSASREGLLPVHDKPPVQHVAHADMKVWMAHGSCARVLPETWLDEAETGPVLEDGARKQEEMVFGVDAIVKDRWNLVSDIPRCQPRCPLTRFLSVEMFGLFQESSQDTWRPDPVHQRQVLQGIPYIVCARRRRAWNSLQGTRRSGEGRRARGCGYCPKPPYTHGYRRRFPAIVITEPPS
jgi:hypothetical protein